MVKTLRKKIVVAMLCALCSVPVWSTTYVTDFDDVPCLSYTDFSVSHMNGKKIFSIDEVDGFGRSLIKPTLKIENASLPVSYAVTRDSSPVFGDSVYAVAYNPYSLDSLRMCNSGSWGLLLGNNASSPTVLHFLVEGISPDVPFEISLGVSNPFREEFLKEDSIMDGTFLPAPYDCFFQVIAGSKVLHSVQVSDANSGEKDYFLTYDTSSGEENIIQDGVLDLKIVVLTTSPGSACWLSSLQVSAMPDLVVKADTNKVRIGGERLGLFVNRKLNGTTIQWFKNGVALEGETGIFVTHVSGDVTGETNYYYTMTLPNGSYLQSEPFVVHDVASCYDEEGEPLSYRMIWQDDFGKFDSENLYWYWDYTDLKNPAKIYTNMVDSWTTDYGLTIPGCEYAQSPNLDGTFTVASNVTCVYDYAETGTKWEWEAQFGEAKTPKENGWSYVPDHTYGLDGMGGMLWLNYAGEAGGVIYSKVIDGLLPDWRYSACCYLNTFSDAQTAPTLCLRLTDLETGEVVVSDTVSKKPAESNDWKKLEVGIAPAGTSLKLEVVSVLGYPETTEGNDMVIDDIQLWAASMPSPHIYYSFIDESVIFDPLPDVEKIWGENVSFLYQYSFSPENPYSWNEFYMANNVEDAAYFTRSDLLMKLDGLGHKDTMEVSVRLVVGSDNVLRGTDLFDFLQYDASYSLSNVLPLKFIFEDSGDDEYLSGVDLSFDMSDGWVISWNSHELATSYVLTIFSDIYKQDTLAVYEFDAQGELVHVNRLRNGFTDEILSCALPDFPAGARVYTFDVMSASTSVYSQDGLILDVEPVSCNDVKRGSWSVFADRNIIRLTSSMDGLAEVSDLLGRTVGTIVVKAGSENAVSLPSGVYTVRFNGEVKKVLVY